MARKLEKCNYQVDVQFFDCHYLFIKPFSEKGIAERCFNTMSKTLHESSNMAQLRLWDFTVSPSKIMASENKK